MLCLECPPGKSVIISVGETRIRVKFIKHRGVKVALGFEAPDHVEIYREEIQMEIDRDRRQSGGGK
jgi:carbon storage regulator CsrA